MSYNTVVKGITLIAKKEFLLPRKIMEQRNQSQSLQEAASKIDELLAEIPPCDHPRALEEASKGSWTRDLL